MTLIAQKVATPTDTKISLKVDKSTQYIDVERYAPLCVLLAQMSAGIPEMVSSEITNPNRERVRPADRVPFCHIALWAQHGTGPLVEIAPAELKAVTQPGGAIQQAALPALADLAADGPQYDAALQKLYKIRIRYYLSDLGAIEILADDHFKVDITNLIPYSSYQFFAPEQPLVAAAANTYTQFEPGVILADSRQEVMSAVGKAGIIFPNRPDIIERVLVTYQRANGTKDTNEMSLQELVAIQARINPVILTTTFVSPDITKASSHAITSDNAEFLLIDLAAAFQFQIDTVLGQQLEYTLISQKARL